jgi:hypothetical protein
MLSEVRKIGWMKIDSLILEAWVEAEKSEGYIGGEEPLQYWRFWDKAEKSEGYIGGEEPLQYWRFWDEAEKSEGYIGGEEPLQYWRLWDEADQPQVEYSLHGLLAQCSQLLQLL